MPLLSSSLLLGAQLIILHRGFRIPFFLIIGIQNTCPLVSVFFVALFICSFPGGAVMHWYQYLPLLYIFSELYDLFYPALGGENAKCTWSGNSCFTSEFGSKIYFRRSRGNFYSISMNNVIILNCGFLWYVWGLVNFLVV